jgi:hypothetical protein
MECLGSCSSLMTRIEAMSERSGLSQLFSECWEILTSKLTPTNTVVPIAALLLVLFAEHACAFTNTWIRERLSVRQLCCSWPFD